MYDIIIIGAGPAGMTAAIYGKRALKSVLILEAITYGGQIINTLDIENYPGYEHINGVDLATKLYEQATNLGSQILFEKVIDIKVDDKVKEVITPDNVYKGKTVIGFIQIGYDDDWTGEEYEEWLEQRKPLPHSKAGT